MGGRFKDGVAMIALVVPQIIANKDLVMVMTLGCASDNSLKNQGEVTLGFTLVFNT